jgi:hypothetical protein
MSSGLTIQRPNHEMMESPLTISQPLRDGFVSTVLDVCVFVHSFQDRLFLVVRFASGGKFDVLWRHLWPRL